MAADIVEDVRFLKIIELVTPPNEAGRREAAAGEMGEENVIRNKTRHRHDPPPGGAVENIAQAAEIRDAARRHVEAIKTFKIFAARPPDQPALLSLEQQPPDRVFLLAIPSPV